MTMKSHLMLAAALAMAGTSHPADTATRLGYSAPNGWATSRGNRSHTKASKTAKNRARAKAAARSRRDQRRR